MAASIFNVALIATSVKLLLVPFYRSTDFEVHRNWLAITHSLPVNRWYYESTSEWTLDYPPLFAWFEFLLSHAAQYFDPGMLVVTNLNYASTATVIFQRLSVILTDIVFIYAVKEFCQKCIKIRRKAGASDIFETPALILAVLLIGNSGLLIVDHIHFQYNGFLMGLMLLSITRIYEGRNIAGALWFAILLNFKHIYLYVAPAYFVYLLRCYCFKSTPDGKLIKTSFSLTRFISLGIVVISVFVFSLGPFLYMDQLPQLLSRLFPFKRGLCHAYWAPNFWALYNIADKASVFIGTRLNVLSVSSAGNASMTGGLVKEYSHTVLPSISPLVTLVATGLSILPSLFHLWLNPRGPQSFVRCLVLCAFGSFMFGWHVHEKAILLILIPLSLLVLDRKRDAQVFLLLSAVGQYSVLPLLFTQFETPVKLCIYSIYIIYAFASLGKYYGILGSLRSLPLLSTLESVYVLGLLPVELYCDLIHFVLQIDRKFPFLPLLITSVYSAVGVTYCWIKFYYLTLMDKGSKSVKAD